MIEILPEQSGGEPATNRTLHSPRSLHLPVANGAVKNGQGCNGQSETVTFGQVQSESPVQLAISVVQGKWKMGILSHLQYGPIRLSQLRRLFPDASKKMLAQHLRELEADGIIVRSDLSGRRRHVEYCLNAAKRAAVFRLIDSLAEWGSHFAPTLPAQAPVRDRTVG